MEVKLPPSDAKNLRGSFYELLQDFSTFPAAQNFFLVTIDRLPKKLNDAEIKKLGLRPYNTKMGVDKNKKVYEKYVGEGAGYMFLATGVDTTSEDNNVNSKGKTVNGLLPTGPYMENTRYPDNDLGVQFYETNISVIDGIFRPWIQLYSVYGNIDNPVLTANIDIYFLSKQQITSRKTSFKSILFGNPGSSSPVIRKIYKYKDCIPFQINDAGVQEYTGDMNTGSLEVKWRFSRYEVQIPHAADPAPAPKPEPKPAIKPQKKKKDLTEDTPDGGEAERLWNEAQATNWRDKWAEDVYNQTTNTEPKFERSFTGARPELARAAEAKRRQKVQKELITPPNVPHTRAAFDKQTKENIKKARVLPGRSLPEGPSHTIPEG